MKSLLFTFLAIAQLTTTYGSCIISWDPLTLTSSYQSMYVLSRDGIEIECRGVKGNETLSGKLEKTICLAKSDTAYVQLSMSGLETDQISFSWEQEFTGNVDAIVQINDSLTFNLKSENQADSTFLFAQVFEPKITIEKFVIKQRTSSSGQITIGSIQIGSSEIATPHNYKYGALIVSEMMIDPEPSVYLPNCEYIELANMSESSLPLSDFSLIINGKRIALPYIDIQPKTCVVLHNGCFGNAEGFLDISLPSLSNEYFEIAVMAGSQLIYSANYDARNYNNVKSGGGWSLEKNDPNSLYNADYDYSMNENGGSPGVISNNLISECPKAEIVMVKQEDENSLVIHFSEQIDTSTLFANQISMDGLNADSISWHTPAYDGMTVFVSSYFNLESRYTLSIESLQTFCGSYHDNVIFEWAIPQKPKLGDVIFNEIMFDPEIGSDEYIEIRNVSDKAISLTDLQIGIYDESNSLQSLYPLSANSRIIFPDSIVLLCSDSNVIANSNMCTCSQNMYQMPNLPSLTNTGRRIGLYNRSLVLIDEVTYSAEMHSRSLKKTKGVSIERTANGWSSSPTECNFGSPGCTNTETEDIIVENNICNNYFTPNGDGLNDVLSIKFESDPNSTCDIIIFSEQGLKIFQIADKMLVTGLTAIEWTGETTNRGNALAGIYVVWICINNEDGDKHILKKPTVLLN